MMVIDNSYDDYRLLGGFKTYSMPLNLYYNLNQICYLTLGILLK